MSRGAYYRPLGERGAVTFWHADEGWGGVEVSGRAGVGSAHFSPITGVSGYQELVLGEPVDVEFGDNAAQGGCQWRVASIRPHRRAD